MKSKKRIVVVGSLLGGIAVVSCFYFGWRISSSNGYHAEDFGISVIHSEIDKDGDGVEDYTDILQGAQSYIKTNPIYKSNYYKGGYPTDGYGVCTDVIWNALKAAGYDLKTMIDQDIQNNLASYPTIEEPDPNIDFRRVKNLNIFFQRHITSITCEFDNPEEWQAGDIVVFEKHVAICSDKRNKDGIPFIIHLDGRGPREKDEMYDWSPVVGHYRWKLKS